MVKAWSRTRGQKLMRVSKAEASHVQAEEEGTEVKRLKHATTLRILFSTS